MKKTIGILIAIFLFLSALSHPASVFAVYLSNLSDRYVTLVYPVRSRDLWREKDPLQLNHVLKSLTNKKLRSTWLFQYDALTDVTVTDQISKNCSLCEKSVFLEVSEKLATDASVSYILGSGDWARPDKAFLSGYQISDREKLVDRIFAVFKRKFGDFPKSVGGWYVDPYTLNYLHNKYGISSYLSVADQYNTDGQRYWGKYFGFPFYPQKYDILSPANNSENKSGVVEVQWAQRSASGSYGNGVSFSQHSVQANDYHGIGETTSFFEETLKQYLFNDKNSFGQLTVGLEAGQELKVEEPEHLRQLEILAGLQNEGKIVSQTLSEFGNWYQNKFPNFSPVVYLEDQKTLWVSSLCYRVGISKSIPSQIFDLRVYKNQPSPDYLSPDSGYFLLREVPSLVETIRSHSPFNIDYETLNFKPKQFSDKKTKFNFNNGCGQDLGEIDEMKVKEKSTRLKEKIENLFSILKFSKLDGHLLFGIQTGKETFFGYWASKGMGFFSFPFQTFSKFKTIRL